MGSMQAGVSREGRAPDDTMNVSKVAVPIRNSGRGLGRLALRQQVVICQRVRIPSESTARVQLQHGNARKG